MRISLLLILCFIASSFTTSDDDAVVKQRLIGLQNEVPLSYNKYVTNYIEVYGVRKSGQTSKMLALSEYYFPIFEPILADYGLPEELKYMAVIESALNPRAVSRVGATGLWQFMYSTAREYKLSVSSYVDERSDPVESTKAAARYLKKMYNKYGDWLMVIASYNCGPGNVNKAIRRSGGKRDFWSIYKYLPRETRGYVPAFIAATYVMEYADVLGIYPDYSGTAYLAFETVTFREELLVSDLVEQLEINSKDLRKANASLVGQIIPGDYNLKLPVGKHGKFYQMVADLYASAAYKIEEFQLRKKIRTYGTVQRVIPDDPNLESILYTIKEGDNLGFISYWYNTGLINLKAWNGLRGNKVVIGQELILYVEKEKVAAYSRFDKLSNRQKNILSSDRGERMLYAKRSDNKFIYHEVTRGETFGSIKALYPGATVDEIRKLNNVDDRSLKPGMYLKIMKNV
ncbi:MAG: transglycosylase SLT domain-containing protein [Bacteroidetes bacterium]|nr:transglycosylase SLT domain-containing protein [Bacteroidota bacterium]